MALELIAAGKAPDLARARNEDQELDAESIYRLAIKGDIFARQIFNRVGRALGIALATLVNIFNLPMYVIGGGVANAWQAFAPSMLAEVRRRSVVYIATMPPDDIQREEDNLQNRSSGRRSIITRALLGSDAGLLGAARLPMIASKPRADENSRLADQGRIVA